MGTDPRPASGGILLLCPAAENIGQLETYVSPLQGIPAHVPGFPVFRPHMGKPFHTFPVLGALGGFPVIEERHFHIRVTVAGRNLRRQNVHQPDAARAFRPAHQTDQALLGHVHAHRHLVQRLILLLNQQRLLRQGILHQGKLFPGHGNLHLKGLITQSQTVKQKIRMGRVPVPQAGRSLSILAAAFRRRVHGVHGSFILFIFLFQPVRDTDQIISIGIEPLLLILPGFLPGVPDVHHPPEYAQDGRRHRGNNSGKHKRPRVSSGAPGAEDRHTAAQQHGNGHGKGRADGQKQRLLFFYAQRGRRLDIHRLPADHRKISGRTVKIPRPQLLGRTLRLRLRFHSAALQRIPADRQFPVIGAHRQNIPQIDQLQAKDIHDIPKLQLLPSGDSPVFHEHAVGTAVFDIHAVGIPLQGGMIPGDQILEAVADIIFRVFPYGNPSQT